MADEGLKFLIVEARFYEDIADELAAGAIEELARANAGYERIEVPGALEIPGLIAIVAKAMEEGVDGVHYDGFIALGCVIRGETAHFDHVCTQSARGLMDLTTNKQLAIANGVLTVENRDQAWARASRNDKNKGREFAAAALTMSRARQRFGLAG